MAGTGNTGKKIARYLERYYVATGLPVLDGHGNPIRKPNKRSDPDYVPPITDYCDCPDGLHQCIPTTTTSTTTSTTSTSTTSTSTTSTSTTSSTTTSTTTLLPPNCDVTGVTWLAIVRQCNGATTNVTIGVSDTTRVFEFFNPITQQFEQATIGNNKITFTVPSNGQTYSTHFRVKGCTNQVQGGFDACLDGTTSTTSSTTSTSTTSTSTTSTSSTSTTQPCNFYHVNFNRTVVYIDCNGVQQTLTNGGSSCNFTARSIVTGVNGVDYGVGHSLNCGTTTSSTTTSTTTLKPCCVTANATYQCVGLNNAANIPLHLEALFSCFNDNNGHFPEFRIEKPDGIVVMDWTLTDVLGGNSYDALVANFNTYKVFARYPINNNLNIYCTSSAFTIGVNCGNGCTTPEIVSQSASCNGATSFTATVTLSHGNLTVNSGGTVTNHTGNTFTIVSSGLAGMSVKASDGVCSFDFDILNPNCGCTDLSNLSISGATSAVTGQEIEYTINYSGSTPTSIDWTNPFGTTLISGGDGSTTMKIRFDEIGTKSISCTLVNECNFDSVTVPITVTCSGGFTDNGETRCNGTTHQKKQTNSCGEEQWIDTGNNSSCQPCAISFDLGATETSHNRFTITINNLSPSTGIETQWDGGAFIGGLGGGVTTSVNELGGNHTICVRMADNHNCLLCKDINCVPCDNISSGSIDGDSTALAGDTKSYTVSNANGASPHNYSYSIDNGGSVSQPNGGGSNPALVTFPTAGTYTLTCVITNCFNGSITITKTITVTSSCVPIDITGVDITTATQNQSVTITPTISGDSPYTNYDWQVIDPSVNNAGVIANGSTLTFTPTMSGNYSVTVSANNCGGQASDSYTFILSVSANCDPAGTFIRYEDNLSDCIVCQDPGGSQYNQIGVIPIVADGNCGETQGTPISPTCGSDTQVGTCNT